MATRFPILVLLLFLAGDLTPDAGAIEPIPNRIVVLTFDDAVKSHYTVVRPLLKRLGFGATFFVTEGFEFATDKDNCMTWDEIAQLHRDGFEIGNHTRDHMAVTKDSLPQLGEQLAAISSRCAEHKIPRPVSFAYPGNSFDLGALPLLKSAGIRFARRGTEPERPYKLGGGQAFEPGLDHTLLIPTAGDARPDWTLKDFARAADLGRAGRIAVLQFHGVPDRAHPWVHTDPLRFEQFMQYLADNRFTVIALRDMAQYVHEGSQPKDPEMVIRDRQKSLESNTPRTNYRPPRSDDELRYWLHNMFVEHGFGPAEMVAATGLAEDEIRASIKRFHLTESTRARRTSDDPLFVLPYPGGRHPRTGFRDGEIRPQRETKCSVFTPWDPDSYVVLDIPEAIWINSAEGRELLYLAHTHIPTMWDKRNIVLPQLEWKRGPAGALSVERLLPNGIAFGARVKPTPAAVRMEMWIKNGTAKTITGLRVQNCVMLSRARGFDQQTSENKLLRKPYAACHNADRTRWIIVAWQPCVRPWGNAPCPCLHSDPQFPDCRPGCTERLVGRLSFYEGTDIEGEFRRIAATGWDRQISSSQSGSAAPASSIGR